MAIQYTTEKMYGYNTVDVETWGRTDKHLRHIRFEQTSRSTLRILQGKRCIGAVRVEDLKATAKLMKEN